MKKDLWVSSTKDIYKGVQLYYFCNLAASVFGIGLLSAVPVIGPLGKMAAGASVVGLFMYMYGVKAFQEAISNEEDLSNVKKLRLSLILVITALFLSLIPVIGWVLAPLVNLTAFIFMLLSFMGLKNSTSFPSPAKEGANKLFIAMIVSCASALISIIPVAGSIIAAILNIVVLVFVLQGWKMFLLEQSDNSPQIPETSNL